MELMRSVDPDLSVEEATGVLRQAVLDDIILEGSLKDLDVSVMLDAGIGKDKAEIEGVQKAHEDGKKRREQRLAAADKAVSNHFARFPPSKKATQKDKKNADRDTASSKANSS